MVSPKLVTCMQVADNTPYEDSGGSGRALDTDAAGKSLESICCLPAAVPMLHGDA